MKLRRVKLRRVTLLHVTLLHVRLQPANSTMEPIYVHAHEARETMILGKVVGVYRQLV